MLFTRRKAPVAVEGTQGRYVKRDSPPPVPSLSTHAVSAARRSPITPSNLSAIAVSPPIDVVTTEPLSYEPFDSDELYDLGDNLADEFAQRQSRSSASENEVFLESSDNVEISPSTSLGFRNNDVLSSRSFNRGGARYIPRKSLTASHSIGNVEQGLFEVSRSDELTAAPQPRFQSLQILPSNDHVMTPQEFSSTFAEHHFIDELPLPPNWAIDFTYDGIRYYVDHTNRRTHWVHPLIKENLRPGWNKYFDNNQGVIYYNEKTGDRQFEHPGIANPIFRTESVNVASRSNIESAADLHIIQEEDLPPWLLTYAHSDTSLDHLLEWDLFGHAHLTQYEEMMRKLYKQQAIDIVRKYERLRNVINREIHRRDASRPPPPRRT